MYRLWQAIKTPLVFTLLLAILAVAFIWGYKQVTAQPPKAPVPPCETIKVGKHLEPWQVLVNVYNSGTRIGLAGRQAGVLDDAGFRIGTIGNLDAGVTKTVVIGYKKDDPEVKLVASYFKDPEIRADGRIDHSVDVIVGNKFPGVAEKPLTVADVPSGELCLPKGTPLKKPTDEDVIDPKDSPSPSPSPSASKR